MSTTLEVLTSFEDLPQEVVCHIFVRLGSVKCVLRSRCVCKSWNTLINSPSFKGAYHRRNVLMPSSSPRKSEYLLVGSANKNSFSLFSAETYDKCLDLDLELPTQDVRLSYRVVGSCHGLLCISSYHISSCEVPIHLWNPSIRRLKRLSESLIARGHVFGFGFQPGVNDYKVVRISKSKSISHADVYSLRSDSWRTITSALPLSSFYFGPQQHGEYFNGVIYRVVSAPFTHSPKLIHVRNCLVAFDTSSAIRKIALPNELANPRHSLRTQVLENALSVVHFDYKSFSADIWVLEKDDTWRMHRTIHLPSQNYIVSPLGFTADGGVHTERRKKVGDGGSLVLYDTKSCPVKKMIETTHVFDFNFVDAYTESLILLG